MRFKRRRDPRQECDRLIESAYESLHAAIRDLRMAHHYAAEMGDGELATLLWEYSDHMPTVTARLDDYLARGIRLPRLS